MCRLKQVLPLLLLVALLLWAAYQTGEIRRLREDIEGLSIAADALRSDKEALQTTLQDKERQNQELSRIILEQQSQIEDMKFKSNPDIPLSGDLQEFTYYRSRDAGIPPEIIFAIMEHESTYQIDAVGYNTNGTIDIGLCQINSCNWSRLADEGINVHDPEGNIQAAIYILSEHREDYPLDKTLAAYNAGTSGMLSGGGVWYADKILERAETL